MSGDATIDTSGVEAALDTLKGSVSAEVARAVQRACMIVHREAVRNAPVSPTNAQYSKAVLKRKKRTKRRMHPGGLSRSIEWETRGMEGSVFVASNSEAAAYARKIHDDKYKSWRRRGPGTIAKGARADDKFIERALNDNAEAIGSLIEKAVASGIRKQQGGKNG